AFPQTDGAGDNLWDRPIRRPRCAAGGETATSQFLERKGRAMSREAIARILRKSGVRAVLGKLDRWSGVLCLNYHRIADDRREVLDRDLWSARTDQFDAQVRFLTRHFDVIGPEDLPEVVARSRGRYAIITFDDGYRDNYRSAFPVLKT